MAAVLMTLTPVVGLLCLAAVIGLAVYGVNAYMMLAVHWWTRRRRRAPPPPTSSWPTVTVQLPLCNERYVAQRLLEAVGG